MGSDRSAGGGHRAPRGVAALRPDVLLRLARAHPLLGPGDDHGHGCGIRDRGDAAGDAGPTGFPGAVVLRPAVLADHLSRAPPPALLPKPARPPARPARRLP